MMMMTMIMTMTTSTKLPKALYGSNTRVENSNFLDMFLHFSVYPVILWYADHPPKELYGERLTDSSLTANVYTII
jgi:hypothetical protein